MGVDLSGLGFTSGVQRACYGVLTAMTMLDNSYCRDPLVCEHMRHEEPQVQKDRRVEG